jgi:hypothetical protein
VRVTSRTPGADANVLEDGNVVGWAKQLEHVAGAGVMISGLAGAGRGCCVWEMAGVWEVRVEVRGGAEEVEVGVEVRGAAEEVVVVIVVVVEVEVRGGGAGWRCAEG